MSSVRTHGTVDDNLRYFPRSNYAVQSRAQYVFWKIFKIFILDRWYECINRLAGNRVNAGRHHSALEYSAYNLPIILIVVLRRSAEHRRAQCREREAWSIREKRIFRPFFWSFFFSYLLSTLFCSIITFLHIVIPFLRWETKAPLGVWLASSLDFSLALCHTFFIRVLSTSFFFPQSSSPRIEIWYYCLGSCIF